MKNPSPHRLWPYSLLVVIVALVWLAFGTGLENALSEDQIQAADDERFRVLYAQLDAGISPAQVDFLDGALAECRRQACDMLLLRLNTPGGLGESMREMVQMILGAPLPVAIWVGPPGARAASAGVFLVAASDVAAMSPASTIGAASPVNVGGGDMDETMAAKVRNDILSLVRGVATARGRNVDWYMKAVEESVSITASEAVMENVVDYVADSPMDLLTQISASKDVLKGRTVTFSPEAVRLVEYDPGARYSILSWLLDPQIAYLLLLGGMAGIFFELTAPGTLFPGVLGGICLLLGLYALSVLPTNVAGLLLILFGLVLFILELYITSFGLLGISGLLCFFIGSTILYRTDYGFGGLPLGTIVGTTLGFTLVFFVAGWLVGRAHFSAPAQGMDALLDTTGTVRNWSGGGGQIFVRGEVWKARGAGSFRSGDVVRVTSYDGLVLIVKPASQDSKKA